MEKQLLEIEKTLVCLDTKVGTIKESVVKIETEQIKLIKAVAALKVKSGVWGAIGGSIPSGIVLAYILIKQFGG